MKRGELMNKATRQSSGWNEVRLERLVDGKMDSCFESLLVLGYASQGTAGLTSFFIVRALAITYVWNRQRCCQAILEWSVRNRMSLNLANLVRRPGHAQYGSS